jgi:hypothetical protein
MFRADYDGAELTCSDGRCPPGAQCQGGRCIRSTSDGGTDAPTDATPHALTCADPMPVPATGGTFPGTTAGRGSTVSSMCNGFIMNGPDAVYSIDLAAGAQVQIGITGQREAYLIQPCASSPPCLGNMRAAAEAPISLTAPAGRSFIVVDDELAGAEGEYTLTVTVN